MAGTLLQRRKLPGLALTLGLAMALAGCDRSPTSTSQTQAADAIYTNARVWTVNPDQAWAEAFAVQDGKFVIRRADGEFPPRRRRTSLELLLSAVLRLRRLPALLGALPA